ncbi:L,D-transpeptidase family protein [Phenylobacterium deserti]|uniref:L,D-TPase catalytic domain-containing protein n=1 Tax=Phenylobacterium deserti TaxID=1914756 RepID=A0A328ARM7_9CAUL|nr:L,D-transpeptidase family protein [Phenylobacterium deserti]RAK57297.1 hypothetical protein DJ018_04950 [Phenylobacterium deserti]
MNFTATADGLLDIGERKVRCALGPAGVVPADQKREGDGASPAGVWPIRRVLWRPDRSPPPQTAIPVEAISEHDGWCDAADDPNYNRPVTLPYSASAERLWRDDHVYDLIVVLGHNDDPPEAGMGSAIFLHVARENYTPTEGCVAVAREDLEELLRHAKPGDAVEIRG